MATVQDRLENKPEKIQDLFLDLQEKILALGDEIVEGSTETYISYNRRGERHFSEIRIQKKAIKIQLTIPHDDIKDPKGISVDVSHKKSHHRVKTEIKLIEADELEYVFGLIEQCYQFERQGKPDNAEPVEDFPWIRFYESVADKLLGFKDKRNELVEGIHEIVKQVKALSGYDDTYKDGNISPLRDICPFTTVGVFNRNQTLDNRKIIARKLADFLGIKETVPEHFDGIGIPVLPYKGWFFAKEDDRDPHDIDTLWEVFEKAIEFSRSRDKDDRSDFIAAYNKATKVKNVGWNLTIGLFWIRPWSFPTLDKTSRIYINENEKLDDINIPKKPPSAEEYLDILKALENKFRENTLPFSSFPELARAGWEKRKTKNPPEGRKPDLFDKLATDCFIDRSKLEKILDRLRTKKNLILQGPPGTGKTWLAKKLAFVLIGRKDNSKVKALQFHPNLSYEDFVRGWRPAGDGKLELVDGPFLQIAEAARKDPTEKHVIVIEEINRGNPAQILGELLTLLEADKRNADEALELCYSKEDGARFFIPENLYVIGTMNIADRSLALVDLALRRRFAFVDLEPVFGEPWENWVHDKFNIDRKILSKIETQINLLNDEISNDPDLGPQFRIGHSYVTPANGTVIEDARDWFRQVVNTEIGPLLDEYWFDNLGTAKETKQALLQGFQ